MWKAVLWLLSVSLIQVARSAAQPAIGSARDCGALKTLSLPHTKVMAAENVTAGAFLPPKDSSPRMRTAYKQLPAFCRVQLQLAPSADSDIRVEVWLPVAGWNGKFRGTDNGGFAGSINYSSLAAAVYRGYATAGTDTGHAAFFLDASWALGHPEKIIDFGYRAIHEMTTSAKAVLKAYYGTAEKLSYFAGCSDGGREALMEAQRFPADYNGILAGAPANKWTGLVTNGARNAQQLSADGASYIPAAKLPALSSAVLAQCDALDGVKDGFLTDPRECHFDPSTLLCKGAEDDRCLNPRQMTALKGLYAGAETSNGTLVYPGFLPGAEDGPSGWAPWITGSAPGKDLMSGFAKGYFSNMVYEKPDWDLRTFRVDEALGMARKKTAQALDAVDPDLKPFLAGGGKLILYHGWNDPAIASLNTIAYYDQMTSVTGRQEAGQAVRLYMVPGMQHCSGGPGPDSFGQSPWEEGPEANNPQHDIYQALEQWVEKGTAPEAIIATKYDDAGESHRPTMTRPLCAYPQVARYKGSGDTNDAGSFVCSDQKMASRREAVSGRDKAVR